MSEFFEHSKSIVEDFLQTAVFLDDRAYFDKPEILENIPPVAVLPKARGIKEEDTLPDTDIEIIIEREEDLSHLLDAKAIIDTFMDKGIVCSVLKCDKDTYDSKRESYLQLIKKADIVVLDWSLFKDNGEKIVSIMRDLIDDGNGVNELRSIIVYTANDLEDVKKKLDEINIEFNGTDPYISSNNQYTTISLFSKKGSKIAVQDKEVDFYSLVEISIIEFTKTFYGIVPNVAMASVAKIRNNTHKLLSVLNKSLDIAYLSHRALLPYSADAEHHLEEIVISEIESIIHEYNVGKNAEYSKIKNAPVLVDKMYNNINFIECLDKGVEKLIPDNKVKQLRKDIKECFTYKWYKEEEESKKSELDFVRLTTLQTKYTDKNTHLSSGVIIKQEDSENHFLCMQPRCDSVRLKDSSDFILLLLDKSNDKFDLLCNGNKYKINFKKEFRKTISFKVCNETNLVLHNDALYYEDVDSKKYKFLNTLKPMQSQKISNEYGAYLSRVGLNESEYLRRSR